MELKFGTPNPFLKNHMDGLLQVVFSAWDRDTLPAFSSIPLSDGGSQLAPGAIVAKCSGDARGEVRWRTVYDRLIDQGP